MRSTGHTVLVSLYELGHPPLGLAAPLAAMRRAGHAPACLDLGVSALDEPALELLRNGKLVAISTPMHTALRLGVLLARRVRSENPSAWICFYGLYAQLNESFLRRNLADSVLGPEPAQCLVELADALASGRPPPASPAKPRRSLTLVPERDGLPGLDRYARLLVDGEARLAGYTEATRGCRYHCRHCPLPPVYEGRFFAVPVQVVLQDVANQVAAGAGHVTLGDPDFLNAPKHALAIARGIHAAHPQLTFDVTTKIEHIVRHRDVIQELVGLGCSFVVSAVESLSDRVLAVLNKGHTRADVLEALRIVRGAGVQLRPTLVPFSPWATLDDYLDLCHFVFDEDLVHEVDPVQLSLRLLVPPGSLLEGHDDMRPHLGTLDEDGLTYRWTHPDPRMDNLQSHVAALVESATQDHEDPVQTLVRLHHAAHEALGHDLGKGRDRDIPRHREPSPRLSEPWFC
ncbi:MAG: radical SAM protein [Deltaproteobacteria bacterium]|nr:radical SAM protein [Deltaproteobacteria bacterium]